jgi:hypothetical protein
VVEIDPEVIGIAARYFDFSPSPRLRVHVADARNFINAAAGRQSYHIVYLDAFNSFSIPSHLTTEEFTQKVAQVLTPDGLFIVNSIDILSIGRFLNAYVNTLERVFSTVTVYAEPGYSRSVRNTFVIVGSDGGIHPPRLYDEEGELIAVALPAEEREILRAHNGNGYLSDNHAPVENLMAPFLSTVSIDAPPRDVSPHVCAGGIPDDYCVTLTVTSRNSLVGDVTR